MLAFVDEAIVYLYYKAILSKYFYIVRGNSPLV